MNDLEDWSTTTTSIIVGATILFPLLLFGFSQIRQCWKPEKAAQKNGNPSNNPQVHANGPEAAEEHHRAAERKYWVDDIALKSQPNWLGRLTVGFSAIAAVATVWGYIEVRRQANEAEEQTKTAKTALISQNRAWIDFTFKPETVSLTWTKEGHGVFSVGITAINRGNSPAINAGVYVIVFLEPFEANGIRTNAGMLKNALDRCDSYGVGWGNALFGDNPVPTTKGSNFGPEIITAYSKSREASLGRKTPDSILKAPPFEVEICATYRIIGDKETHKTIRTYSFNTVVANLPQPITVGVDVEPGHLFMLNDTEVDYAD